MALLPPFRNILPPVPSPAPPNQMEGVRVMRTVARSVQCIDFMPQHAPESMAFLRASLHEFRS